MSAVNALNIYKAIDFQLRVEAGPDKGRAFRIRPPKIIIGRDPQFQVTVTDPRASRKQCSITFGENIVLTDESSRKSTRINGQPFSQHNLVPGDVISFGDSKIRFAAEGKTNQPAVVKPGAKPASPNQQAPGQRAIAGIPQAKQSNRPKPFFIALVVIAILLGILILLPSQPGGEAEKLTTTEELNNQIASSKEYQKLLRQTRAEKVKVTSDEYQVSVEQHFIRGFRDYQTENFSRAAQAFGAAVAKDPEYGRALRYAQLAEQRKEQGIDRHMQFGSEYKEKTMYSRCAAEFEKAMILMNKPDHPKYKLAKESRNECRILKQGGF